MGQALHYVLGHFRWERDHGKRRNNDKRWMKTQCSFQYLDQRHSFKSKGWPPIKNVFYWALAEKLGWRQKGKGPADILSHCELLQIHFSSISWKINLSQGWSDQWAGVRPPKKSNPSEMLINSTAAGRNGNDDRGHSSSNGTPAIFNNWTQNIEKISY